MTARTVAAKSTTVATVDAPNVPATDSTMIEVPAVTGPQTSAELMAQILANKGTANVATVPAGKYHRQTTGRIGKAYMVILADGSGCYVNRDGAPVEISATDARKRFDAGMSTRVASL